MRPGPSHAARRGRSGHTEAMTTAKDVLVAHISDPHVDSHSPERVRPLRQAVAHLMSLPRRPDVVIVTGDLTEHGEAGEYEQFRGAVAALDMPLYVIPGNHDDRARMQGLFGEQGTHGLPGFMQYQVDAGPLRLLMLDTHVPGEAGGRLDGGRLEWLAERLAQEPERPTLVALHHPPLGSGVQVMDAITLDDPQALERVITAHPNVLRVLCGHMHTTTTQAFAGTVLMTLGGTEGTFLPDLGQPEKFVIQVQPGLCLLHHWRPGAGLTSFTSVIEGGRTLTLYDGQKWAGQ